VAVVFVLPPTASAAFEYLIALMPFVAVPEVTGFGEHSAKPSAAERAPIAFRDREEALGIARSADIESFAGA